MKRNDVLFVIFFGILLYVGYRGTTYAHEGNAAGVLWEIFNAIILFYILHRLATEEKVK